jgi:hypothetical protein
MNTSKNNTAIPVAERYQYDIDLSADTAAARVIRLTGEQKSVLELGPGPGTILRYLVRHQQCTVSAVELDKACADALRDVCQTVVHGDLDQSDWLQAFAGQSFDVIIAADVLEHLAKSVAMPTGYAQSVDTTRLCRDFDSERWSQFGTGIADDWAFSLSKQGIAGSYPSAIFYPTRF